MQTYKNNKVMIIISAIVLILIGGGIYYKYYSATETMPEGCAEGYKFNILTGKPCPDTNAVTVPTEK